MKQRDDFAFALKKSKSFFYHVFLSSTVGQIIVDENLNILFSNNRMFEYFGTEPYDTTALPFGRAFFCRELGANCHECGKSMNGIHCGIINAMKDIQDGKTPIHNRVIHYSFQRKNLCKFKWFLLNGTQIIRCDKHYAVLAFTDITELKQQEEQLMKNLTLDLATGTLNKCTLLDTMQKLMESGLQNCGFTVCMIDFDNFKEINDQHGHLMGDRVLRVFSDIAQKHVRKDDVLGRFGGEEFVFIFKDADEQQSVKILKRIHIELEEYFAEKFKIHVTFSAGIIAAGNEDFILPIYTRLLDKVDRMLYQAKNCGRGRAMSSKGETLFTSADIFPGIG